MAATDKCLLFLIGKDDQDRYIQWQSDKDCWSYISKHLDECIEIDFGDTGILGYTANSTFEIIYQNKLYKNNRVLIDVTRNQCIFICYESIHDSDDPDKDYPNEYPDNKPLI